MSGARVADVCVVAWAERAVSALREVARGRGRQVNCGARSCASLSEDVRDRIELNPLRAFDSDHPGTRTVMESAPRLLEHLSDEDAAHFAEVRLLLDTAGVPYEVDSTLVRGLDYYTRTVFEFTSDALGAQSGVGGGGRYDRLVERLGGSRRAHPGEPIGSGPFHQ